MSAGHARVEAAERHDAVLQLKIATGAERSESRFDDSEVRAKAGGQRSAVDVIKWLGKGPRVFHVVDLEDTVTGDTAELVLCLGGKNCG